MILEVLLIYRLKNKKKLFLLSLFVFLINVNLVLSQNITNDHNQDSIAKLIEKAIPLLNKKDSLNPKKGLNLLSQSEELLQNSTNHLLKLKVYRLKTDFYIDNQNLAQSKVYLDKSFKILEHKNFPLEEGYYYEHLGIYFAYLGNRSKATESYLKAEKLLTLHGNIDNQIDINYNLSLSFYKEEEWKKSSFYCLETLNLLTKKNKPSIVLNLNVLLLKNHLKLKEYNTAKLYVNKIENIINKNDSNPDFYRANYALGDYYYSLNKHIKATNYYKKASQQSVDFFFNRRIKKIKANEIQHQLDYEKLVNQRFQTENNLNKARLNSFKFIGLCSLLLILILIVFVFVFYKNAKYKERINIILKEDNFKLSFANNKAEKALKVRSDFLRTITHELRTPINSIIGISYLLKSVNLDEEFNKNVKTLNYSSNYLLGFVNNIINLNNIIKRDATLFFETTNLKTMLYEIIETYKLNDENNNTFYHDIDSNIPDFLLIDKLKISQIIFNLLNNAFKFTEHGDIYLSAKLISKNKNKANIQFSIKDTGIGISEEKKKHIFLPYTQGDKNTKDKYGGSGIGLTVVKDILTIFKSEIHLESETNKGTTFTFNINFKIPKPSKQKCIKDYTKEQLNKISILLVEDNKINQKITAKIIQDFGLNCDIASSGLEAISMTKHKEYHLILMDIMMPEMDGFETSAIIRKEHPNANIIALTALTDTENDSDFKKHNIQTCLTKPFHPDELQQKILEHINFNELD